MFKRTSKALPMAAATLTPAQIAKAYNFPAVTPTMPQQCVAILELGGGIDLASVEAYCKAQGVKPPEIIIQCIDKALEKVTNPSGPDGEVGLDVCVVAALYSGVKILLVFAPNTAQGFADGIAYCATHESKPGCLSISWGGPESGFDAANMAHMEAALDKCKDAGMNIFVAAGDNGDTDGLADGKNHVDYPGSSPQVISCGGTQLEINPDGSRKSEVVWGPPVFFAGATGGGMSNVFPAPDYQKKLGFPKRVVPDLSGNACPASGWKIQVDGIDMAIGGTSAVAPMMAALSALIAGHKGKNPSNMQELMYQHPECFYDVVNGDNGSMIWNVSTPEQAKPGFDLASGLGVPDGTKLMNLF